MVIEAQRGSARVHLVNHRYDRIGDLPCAPTLADLDGAVDLVLLGVPDTALMEQLESAVALGARSAVLFGSALGLREKIAVTAADAGMALCGAGCMGFVNNALGVRALGYLEPDPLPVGGNKPGHPFGIGVLDVVACPARIRLPACGVVRAGTRHGHRRLRGLRAR
jgi:acetate---CoA ligase (ADP-forming)